MNAQGQGQQFAPAFGGFMNDPTTAMGIQVGKTAMMAGQEYMEQNVSFLRRDNRSYS
jgi:protein transport protein YIF1